MSSDGAVQAQGNGRLLVYSLGANITHVYGEPYTSQSLLAARWMCDGTAEPEFISRREPGTSIWEHTLHYDGKVRGLVRQFVDTIEPVLLMHARLSVAATLEIMLPADYTCFRETPRGDHAGGSGGAGLLVVAPDTARILFYLAGTKAFALLRCWGEGFQALQISANGARIEVGTGDVYIAIAGSVSMPDLFRAADSARSQSYETCCERRRATDRALLARLDRSWQSTSTVGYETADAVSALSESVAVLVTAQQSADGGIVAGYPFPFAYSRDQYGCCRGLLALGLWDEVRRNVEFRFGKWQRFGNLANAESMGQDRIRHIHECDDVEQTAYTILETMEYVDASGDVDCLRSVFPMLEWCLAAQLPHLRNGMLPFNGDETYVAGGFLPRSALLDGSFEATLLFVEAGRRLLAAASRHRLLTREQTAEYAAACAGAAASLREHFLRGGTWVVNAPDRRTLPGQPQFRHGVCEGCGPTSWFGWTERSKAGRYLCPRCAESAALGLAGSTALEVFSAGLLPLFIGATALSGDDCTLVVRRAGALFRKLGYLPTLGASHRAVGYDAALLLYALSVQRDPLTSKVREHVLSLADSAGAWCEYYEVNRPIGTRCRPWESGVSIAAILESIRRQSAPAS